MLATLFIFNQIIMLIISKIKDYYDYFQGIFGIDKKKILKRSNYILFEKDDFYMSSRNYNIHIFAINNKMYFLIETKKGYFYRQNHFLKI